MRIFRLLRWLVLVVLLLAAWIAYQLWGPAVALSEKKYLYIAESISREQLTTLLKQEGFLTSGYWFSLVSDQLQVEKIKAGRYEIKPNMSVMELVRLFRNGRQSLVKLTIVKERTLQQLAGKIGNRTDTRIDSLDCLLYLTNSDSLRQYGIDTNTLLSIVMPFTYEIGWAETPGQIVDKMYERYQQFWDSARTKKAAAKGLTPLQVSILASIVEEESNRQDDRYNIASTYINRLRIGMKLQADPTVKYATRNFGLNRILHGHLALNSPYNTYRINGLPPGPICTPSIKSIEAVLDAPDTDYLYFVASYQFDGSTLFSSTYAQHQAYVKLFHAEQQRRLQNKAPQ